MTSRSFYTVDAFVQGNSSGGVPFTGNPAAVVVCETGDSLFEDSQTCQKIAAQMNLSETAFVRPSSRDDVDIRWFTPSNEVPLCGHATLASAFALLSNPAAKETKELKFHTLSSGILVVSVGPSGLLSLSIGPPAELKPRSVNDFSATLQTLLGTSDLAPLIEPTCYVGATKLLVVALSQNTLRDLPQPPTAALKATHDSSEFRGVVLTAPAADGAVVSRYFAPWNGIPEDPVNGSGHALLAPFWADRLGEAKPRLRFQSEFASARGGSMECELAEDRLAVILHGRCRMVVEGVLRV